MPAEFIPAGYHTVTPFLVAQRATGLIEFLERVFRAEVTERLEHPDGSIRHAELRIGDSKVMIGEAGERYPPYTPRFTFTCPTPMPFTSEPWKQAPNR